jgi:glutamine amidotransferase-like uncharacterized protein
LRASRWHFQVYYTGPREELPLTSATLVGAALYAQPGGGTLTHGYKHLKHQRAAIRRYVAEGGCYLGFCLGGYLSGATPGFDLLPGDTDQYITSPGATVKTEDQTLVQVRWRGHEHTLFFQDGPHFVIKPGQASADTRVLATYPNHTIAALVTTFRGGRVAVVGPHPEATNDWFTDAGLPVTPSGDVGLELIDELMGSRACGPIG